MKDALVIVDVQKDFCQGGALAVPAGDEVVPVLNQYIRLFKAAGMPVFATRDWHPRETVHFMEFGGKWPPHCVQGTDGARFHLDLELPDDVVIVTKGMRFDEDSYSGFDGIIPEGLSLEDALKRQGVDHIYVGGLATDYCVRQTVLDALKRKFRVTLLLDAVMGVDLAEGDSERAIDEMIENGAVTAIVDEVVLA